MTQNRFLILLFFFVAGLNLQQAQTIAVSDCNPNPNLGAKFAYGTSQTFSPGSAGTHQIWDFTSYTFQAVYTDTFAYVPSNYLNFFPNADIMRYVTLSTAAFFRFAPAGIEKVGDFASGLTTYIDPVLYKPCPISYGTSTVDAWSYTWIYGGPSTVSVTGSTTITADGSGDLVSLGGMFSNVMRLHYASTYTSVSTNTVYAGTYVTNDYLWFADGIYEPVFELRNGTAFTSRFSGPNQVGIPEESSFVPSLGVFPNPATNELQLCAHASPVLFSLRNNLGQVILEEYCGPEKTLLDISAIPTGIYFCHVQDLQSKKQSCTKLIVSR